MIYTEDQKVDIAEELYKLYPRREGKAKGIARLIKLLKNSQNYQEIVTSIENYKKIIKIRGTEKQFIMMFSTFMNGRWQDYLEIEESELQKLEFDFDKVFDLYPKKGTKESSIAYLKTVIKTKEDYNNLLSGVMNFSNKIKQDKTEDVFIPLFINFCKTNRWLDFVNTEDKPKIINFVKIKRHVPS